jgi:hypothetical protein
MKVVDANPDTHARVILPLARTLGERVPEKENETHF